MALVVEDGSIVSGANSYVSVAFANNYMSAREFSSPGNDAAVEALLLRAMDFLNGIDDWIGNRTDTTQELDWPRMGVPAVDQDAIPRLLQNAQVELIRAIEEGIDIFPNRQAGEFITEERVGPIQTRYSPFIGTDSTPTMGYVDRVLSRYRSPRYTTERA